MESRGSLAAVVVLAALAVLWPDRAGAVDGCRAGVRRSDGTVLVSARNVNGPLQWCTSPGQNCQSSFNDPPCVSDGQARGCVLGVDGTVARITAPAGCRIYLQDNIGAGTGTCAAVGGGAYIRGCTPSGDSPPAGADISARLCRTGVLTVPTSMNIAVPCDTERWDTDNIHDPGEATKLKPTMPGKYLVYAHVAFIGPLAGGFRQVAIYKNGDPIALDSTPPNSDGGASLSLSTHATFDGATDYVELLVFQSSGGPLDLPDGCHPTQNYASDFGMVKLP